MYRFLKPQSIHNTKDRCDKCQLYIQTWLKESQRDITRSLLESVSKNQLIMHLNNIFIIINYYSPM